MDTSKLRGSTGGESLAYYTVVGSPGVSVDIDAINVQAKAQLTPPRFAQGSDVRVLAIAGEPLSATLSAVDSDQLSYTSGTNLPAGASLDQATGVLTWQPTAGQVGDHNTFVVASDSATDAVLRVRLSVSATRQDAVTAALAGYDAGTTYVRATRSAVDAAKAAAEADIATADPATFAADLVALQTAVARLEKLTPTMPDDGSFDYWGHATSASLSQVAHVGAGFRVTADAFGLQARYNFGNRSQGANVYGSNDGGAWTLLTSRETTDTSDQGFALERIPVRDDVLGDSFRFLKIQVDHPGVPTDPAYPGLSSFSEFRIYGQRLEMSTAINQVSIASNGNTS
jgi:hypothetical protein